MPLVAEDRERRSGRKPRRTPYESITRLARSYGMTVPKLKSVLAKAGYLDGRTPTDRAMREYVAISVPLDQNGEFEADQANYYRWNLDWVVELLEETGNAGKKGLGVWSYESALALIGRSGRTARLILRPDGADQLSRAVEEAEEAGHGFVYRNFAGPAEAGHHYETELTPMIEALAREGSAGAALPALQAKTAIEWLKAH